MNAVLFDVRLPERFWKKVKPVDCGCWNWTAGQMRGGYGRFRFGGKDSKNGAAHRFSYEKLFGKVKWPLQLDHLCRNRICVNPNHLEPVTARENTLRGETRAAANARKTHCIRGHPFDDANTYFVKDRNIRMCRTCAKERMRMVREQERNAGK
jgi:hypothetical protein